MDKKQMKGRIEALLFAYGDPMSIKDLSDLLEVVPDTIETLLEELKDDYLSDDRGIYILTLEDRIQLGTKPMYSDTVKKLASVNERQSLSKGALECLAIIAYKQPVTRVEVDEIRGVSSEYVLNKLLERDMVKILGRKDVPGRPRLYGTTDEFLKQFGFSDLKLFSRDETYLKLIEDEGTDSFTILEEKEDEEDN